MNELLKELGLSETASEEDAVKSLKSIKEKNSQLEKDKSNLEATNKSLTDSVEAEKSRYKTLEDSYKKLVEQEQQNKDSSQSKDDILLELADLK